MSKLNEMGRAIGAIIPNADVTYFERGADTMWKVCASDTVKLSQLRRIEALIGHDAIDLVPAEFDGGYSEWTPGEGLIEGYLEFAWNP
jgi:hypothetical protein